MKGVIDSKRDGYEQSGVDGRKVTCNDDLDQVFAL